MAKNFYPSGQPMFHQWRKTHPDGTMDEYFTDVQGLTPYDKGTRLEPLPWIRPDGADNGRPFLPSNYGKVDFDDEESSTVATLWIERQEDGSYVLKGYSNAPLKVDIETEA